jgi:hypothetical protein
MALGPVSTCLFDVKVENLCQFEKFVFVRHCQNLRNFSCVSGFW